MKELIKENATYKLFLISLLDNFEDSMKSTNDKSLKRYFRVLISEIENVLGMSRDDKSKTIEILKEMEEKE